jgi:glyoxylase-like metal-dependent hydrolase (beta-lactamase superfamily II)
MPLFRVSPFSSLVAAADPTRRIDIAMIYWLVRGRGHTILVDSGFYRPQFFRTWKVQDFQMSAEALGRIRVHPADITEIVLTHIHWDHVDGMDLFPNARIWLQKEEYTYYTGPAWQTPKTHGGIDPDDVLALVKLNLAGRVSSSTATISSSSQASAATSTASTPWPRSSSP